MHRDEACVINRRYAFDSLALRVVFRADDSAFGFRLEGILYQDGDILVAHRIDCRRIDHLRTEVAKFHRLSVTQTADGIRGRDDTGVGRHETVHIRPDLQAVSIQGRSEDGSRIIRTSPPEIGHFATVLVCRNKSGYQCHTRNLCKSLTHQAIGQFRIQDMLGVFLFGLDKQAGIIPACPVNQSGNNARRHTFAVADDGCRGLGRQVLDEIKPLENVLQFVKQRIDHRRKLVFHSTFRDDGIDHLIVPARDFLKTGFVCHISGSGNLRCAYKFICNSTQSGNYDNDRFGL